MRGQPSEFHVISIVPSMYAVLHTGEAHGANFDFTQDHTKKTRPSTGVRGKMGCSSDLSHSKQGWGFTRRVPGLIYGENISKYSTVRF